jgi:hypothetical protein
MLDIIKVSNLTTLGENPPAGDERAPGWSFFTERIDHVLPSRPHKTSAQPYDTYVGIRHGKQGFRLTLQANFRAFLVVCICIIFFLITSNAPVVIGTLMKIISAKH